MSDPKSSNPLTVTPASDNDPNTAKGTVRIGWNKVSSLVSISEMMAHLRLLEAFDSLSREVKSGLTSSPDNEDPLIYLQAIRANGDRAEVDLGEDHRWHVFLHQAVQRFSLFLAHVVPNISGPFPTSEQLANSKSAKLPIPRLSKDDIPPLDVLMVWHTYMLNPRTFYEDSVRNAMLIELIQSGVRPRLDYTQQNMLVRKGLAYLGRIPFPLDELDELLTTPPSSSRISNWERQTKSPFEPQKTVTNMTRIITCPACNWNIEVPLTTTIDGLRGDGAADPQFSTRCPGCRISITNDIIAGAEFWRDVDLGIAETVKRPDRDEITDVTLRNYPVIGTLLDRQVGTVRTPGERESDRRLYVLFATYRVTPLSRPQTLSKTLAQFTNGLSAESYSRQRVRIRTQLSHIARRYQGAMEGPWGVELVDAIKRQAKFVHEMVTLGWAKRDRLDANADIVAIERARVRYHAFLDLMAVTAANKFCVPTLDIDLAWHTHQLQGTKYRVDTKSLVGRFVDHDDKVEEGSLSKAFEMTAKAWRSQFNQPYSLCGCHIPTTVSDDVKLVLKSIKLKLSRDKRPAQARVAEKTEVDYEDATHPSAHSAVYITNNATLDSYRHKRRERAKKQMETGVRRPEHPEPFASNPYGHYSGKLEPFYFYNPGVLDCRDLRKGGCCAGGCAAGGVSAGSCLAGCPNASGGAGCSGGGGGCGGGVCGSGGCGSTGCGSGGCSSCGGGGG